LEALRGIAALVVFSGHFCEGLVPRVTASLEGTVLFAPLNGPAAVVLFFVLSGFVLTLRPLQARGWGPLVVQGLKRWPRLAAPVTMAGLAYALAAMIGAFPDASEFVAKLPPHPPAYLFWGQAQHNAQWGDVLGEASFGTFMHESARHNGVLWTMHWEFLGSFLALCSAAIMLLKLPMALRAAMFTALWVAAAAYSPWLIAFPCGVIGAVLHHSYGKRIRIPNWLAIGMLVCAAVLLSWDSRTQIGMWTWTGSLGFAARLRLWIVTQTLAACLCMTVALGNPTIRGWLASAPGRIAGQLSFAFYLVHLLILCSFSSWLYILFLPAGPGLWSGAGLFLVSLIAAALLATPLMLFDQWWLSVIGSTARTGIRALGVIARGRTQAGRPPLA